MTSHGVNGSPREFVGMHRPPWDEVAGWRGYVSCSCGSMLTTVPQTREHWQLGHFDRPLYRDEDGALTPAPFNAKGAPPEGEAQKK